MPIEQLTNDPNTSLIVFILIVIFVWEFIIRKIFKLFKKKKGKDVSLDLYNSRRNLRKLDELLENLQKYFLKVEKRLSKR